MTRRQTAVLLTSVGLLILGIIAAVTIAARFVVHRVEQLATRAVTRKEEMADIATIVTRVRDLNRLETATMRVTSVSTIKQSYDLIPNALAGDELTLYSAGDVIAGVDLSQLKKDDVHREPDGTIVVRLPPPQLLVSRLDNRASHVIQRRTGVFRRADIGMEGRARQYAEQNIRNEALNRGILPLAQQNAEARVAELLHTLGAAKVRFENVRGRAEGS
jgi:MFS superfamily sulfate permease-like transporter